MTISLRTELSHPYSYDEDVESVFKITLVGEKQAEAKGFHHIIVLDTSHSMAGKKIELAKKGALEYAKRIPAGNKISFISFADSVRANPNVDLTTILSKIKAEGMTALYSALTSAFELAQKTSGQGWILLLTDGHPTDVKKPEAYASLKPPLGYRMIEFGIGDDYREDILKTLADSSGGLLYHLTDPEKLPNLMQESAVNQVAGRDITVDFEGEGAPEVRVLNYTGPPVQINALENIAKIWGEVEVPAGFKGRLMDIEVSYNDAVDGSRKTLTAPIDVRTAKNSQEYEQGIRNNLLSEFKYYQGLEEYYRQLAAGQFKEATKTINQLSMTAEQTRRTDIIESTKRLSEQHEQTLRLGGKSTENTSRLLKEAASETTKRTRGK
jgi:Ca-activated chloride channel family protein